VAAPFRRDQLSIATGFFAHGGSSDEIVLDIVHNPAGYIWSFPRPDHLAIGICAQAGNGTTPAALRARTRQWIDATSIGAGARLEQYAWPIPSLNSRDLLTLSPSGPGWLLVGDAAGLVDPVTREGIFFALESARLAAEALTSGDDPAKRYRSSVRRHLASELARAARLKSGFFRPRFTRLLMRGLAGSDAIRHVMADLIAGTQGYRTLAWRLARTMEVGLAWEFLTDGGPLRRS
jgi:flavin-dependent dehydrogenase